MRRASWLAVLATLAIVALLSLVYVAARPHGGGLGQSAVRPSTTEPSSPAASLSGAPPAFAHIFLIVDENKSYGEIVGNAAAPYLNGLIKRYALATNYFALFHPSLPNYIALTSGSNNGVTDDRGPTAGNEIAAPNIADRIETGGLTWREYAESMPSAGYAFDAGEYATKHDPFVYYKDIVGDAQRARTHIVPLSQMATDLRSAKTTPNFAFITPNLCNDMHDCPTATGDRWLSRMVPLILQSEAFTTSRSLLIVTWDEGTLFDNRVVTILAGNGVKAGYRSGSRYDHYSLLHTIEAAWRLAPLTANDAHAPTMNEFFK